MVIPAELTTTNNVTAIHCSDDAGLTNASCDNGNNNNELLPAAALGTSSIQEYIEDQRELDPDKKVPYILMLARGIHENVPMDVDITNAEPFKTALAFNILKRKPLSLSKALLCQELKRRNPDWKMNINNKKVDDLFSFLLKEDNICDPADIAYIQGETTVYIDNLKFSIDDVEKKRKDSGGRIEASDRLRYIMALDLDGSIREAYMRSQDVMNRQELDARNSVAAAQDFHSLISAKFNNIDWVPKTSVNSDLHSYFAEEVACPKRDSYSMTIEKSKQLVQDMKHRLNEICKRYERSGNGSGQIDSDSGEDDQDFLLELNFGRFNLELALMKGGDDRQNFLNHEPVDLLYWWDVMDRHNLLHFTTAQLRGANAATSDGKPSKTSYQRSRSNTPTSNSSKKKAKFGDVDSVMSSLQGGLNDNVSTVGFALCKMNEQCVMEQIDVLTHRKRDLKNEWRKEKKLPSYDSDEDGEFYSSSIKDIEQLIDAKIAYLGELKEEHEKRTETSM